MKLIFNLFICFLLVGCTKYVETTRTSFFNELYKKSGSIFVVATDSKVNDSLEFAVYKSKIEKQLALNGYNIVKNANDAEQIALVSYGVGEGINQLISTPIFGDTGGGFIMNSNGTGISTYIMPNFGTIGVATNSVTSYKRTIAMDIVNAKDFKLGNAKSLLELRATSIGICGVMAAVFDQMLTSMFHDFPGKNGESKKSEVEYYPGAC